MKANLCLQFGNMERSKIKILSLSLIILIALSTLLSTLIGCNKKTEKRERLLDLRLVHSPEVGPYLSAMAEQFALTKPILPDGTQIRLELKQQEAFSAAKSLADGSLKTHAWLAPHSSLINFTNSNLRNLGPRQIGCSQLFATPVVVASHAKNGALLNAAQREFSWRDISNELSSSSSFSSMNKVESRLRFSHGSPFDSSTGLPALLQLAYMATSPNGALTLETLLSPDAKTKLKLYESLVGHYGSSELALLKAVSDNQVASFAIISEQQLATYNLRQGKDSTPLVALYPSEGAFWIDYNLCFSEADWVTPAHRAAVALLLNFLSTEPAQRAAKERGFRPSIVTLPAIDPLTKEFGIDSSKPTHALLPVAGEIVTELVKLWPELKRPQASLYLMDCSGSMEGAALRVGKDHFRKMIAASSKEDLTAIMPFSTVPAAPSQFSPDSASSIRALDELKAIGGSSIYDSIKRAFETISVPDLAPYRKRIVLFTDGNDKNSSMKLSSLINYLGVVSNESNVRLIIVALGYDTNFEDLREIARASRGIFLQSGLDDMQKLFAEIERGL